MKTRIYDAIIVLLKMGKTQEEVHQIGFSYDDIITAIARTHVKEIKNENK